MSTFDEIGIKVLPKNFTSQEDKLSTDDFLKIKESLSRIGVKNTNKKMFFPTCVILHKQGTYKIMHYKELMLLDRIEVNVNSNDIMQRNKAVSLLRNWGLLEVADQENILYKYSDNFYTSVIPFNQKSDYKIINKYQAG